MRLLRSIIAIALAALLAPAPAAAQEPPGGTAPRPVSAPATIGAVKIDIVEKVDGKESKENLAAYFIRRKLQELGFDAWSAKPIARDERSKKKKGDAVASGPAKERAPDFVITGTVEVRAGKTSVFYGKIVAYEYEASADIKIVDANQRVVAKFQDADRWGRQTEKEARDDTQKRIAIFVSTDILKTDPIRARLDDKKKAQADDYIASVEKKRAKFEKGAEGDGAQDGGVDGK